MREISEVGMGLFLLYCAVCDLKKGQIQTNMLCACAAVTLLSVFLCCEQSAATSLVGGLLGFCFLAVSYITREAVGYADSILLIILGIFFGAEELLILMLVAFGTAALVALVGIVCGKWNRKKTLPFVPFLLLGYMGVMIL